MDSRSPGSTVVDPDQCGGVELPAPYQTLVDPSPPSSSAREATKSRMGDCGFFFCDQLFLVARADHFCR